MNSDKNFLDRQGYFWEKLENFLKSSLPQLSRLSWHETAGRSWPGGNKKYFAKKFFSSLLKKSLFHCQNIICQKCKINNPIFKILIKIKIISHPIMSDHVKFSFHQNLTANENTFPSFKFSRKLNISASKLVTSAIYQHPQK